VETTSEFENYQGIFNLKEHCDGELIASEFQSLQIDNRIEIPFLKKNIKKVHFHLCYLILQVYLS